MSLSSHPLDNPSWSALSWPDCEVSLGNLNARRYRPQVSPISGVRDTTVPECWESLRTVDHTDGLIDVFVPAGTVPPPSLWQVEKRYELTQMVCTSDTFIPPGADHHSPHARRLQAEDGAAMVTLARLTDPGPMENQTYLAGRYLGVFDAQHLIAMAGERMRFEGFTEVSAVCTHPSVQRQGYASLLVSEIVKGIIQRGDTAFLHVSIANHRALQLYRKLGFAERCRLDVVILRKNTQG